MLRNRARIFIFTLLILLLGSSAFAAGDAPIGDFVKAADYIVYGELSVTAVTNDGAINGTLTVIKVLEGKLDKKVIPVSIDVFDPRNTFKLKSDLTNLNVSVAEDFRSGTVSMKKVVAMIKGDGEDRIFLRFIPLFRPDRLELYVESYQEIVRLTKITDKKKLLKAIKYDLGEDFSFSLYNHCFDELFKLDISFGELFSTAQEFLIAKEEKKNYSWFKILQKSGKNLQKNYDDINKKDRDSYMSYLLETFADEPANSEYRNRLFLETLTELKRLLKKDPTWRKKFHDTLKDKELLVKGLDASHYRNQKIAKLRDKLLRTLNKQ